MVNKRALLSVWNKNGIVEFAQDLVRLGYEIVSTGGTAKKLQEAGIVTVPVSTFTGMPEILDGRVKTLHPHILGGILSTRDDEHLLELKKHEIMTIDIVAVNLYPFAEVTKKEDALFEEAVENIDIGGPTMIRSAAKNFHNVVVVVDPSRYQEIVRLLEEKGEVDESKRLKLAQQAFEHTAQYERFIADYFSEKADSGKNYFLKGIEGEQLRYGENPHQKAFFYKISGEGGLEKYKKIQGKELSFNNILDVNSALQIVKEFDFPAAAVVKHTNPCGAAAAEDISFAFEKAFSADPASSYGGIVAVNRQVDEILASKLSEIFLEVIAAPSFSSEALEKFARKKNLRLLEIEDMMDSEEKIDIKKVQGGFLVQEVDRRRLIIEEIKQVSGEEVNDQTILENLLFAWKVVKHVKSNAVVVAKDFTALGIGAGQMNRIGAAKLALETAGEKAQSAVLASDAFLPFRDTVDLAAEYGIKYIIQPGGSVRDEECKSAAKESSISMFFTGIRHFKH